MNWYKEISPVERRTFKGCFSGWALDGVDTQMFSLVIPALLTAWGIGKGQAGLIGGATLAAGAIGGLLAGMIADRFGRVRALQITVCWFSLFTFLSAFAQNFEQLLVLKTLQGLGFGGEWTAGAVLLSETIRARHRGKAMGIVQSAWGFGWGGAVLLYTLVFSWLPPEWAWRVLFAIGVLPALLVLYVRAKVPESPAWKQMEKRARPGLVATLKQNWKLSIYAVVLMTAFNFFSHGTQDLYPTFLREQHHFDPHTVSWITIVLNIGAIVGGLTFGWLSERIGRRRAIFIAAMIALPVLPLWAFSTGALALAAGAFLMQISVQGAWGVIPVHLNEISPDEIRATFPGFVYQLGNLLASGNATLQAQFAVDHGNNYGMALATVAGIVAVVICVLIVFSRERRGIDMTQTAAMSPTSG